MAAFGGRDGPTRDFTTATSIPPAAAALFITGCQRMKVDYTKDLLATLTVV